MLGKAAKKMLYKRKIKRSTKGIHEHAHFERTSRDKVIVEIGLMGGANTRMRKRKEQQPKNGPRARKSRTMCPASFIQGI